MLSAHAQEKQPVRVGVIGLVHTHVHWILGRDHPGDIEIVGIVEPNRELAERYSRQHGFSMDIVYSDIEKMLDDRQPQAVTAFNTIKGHLKVVQKCAPRGIHVMVEKPLAVSLSDALEMKALADQHDIMLLTNYETTWYPTTQKVIRDSQLGAFGELRKIVVNDGHQGPEEIGVNQEFLEWLTDPEYNGAGALTDFGCYGANIITLLMNNQSPESVTAVTQQIKPDKYPKVEDEATIILTYSGTQGIIQASWNWTFSRKDLEVYGTKSYVKTIDGSRLRFRKNEQAKELLLELDPLPYPDSDPFALLSALVNGHQAYIPDLNSLENNMIVMRILDAAMRSSREGKTIYLEQ
jgi:predicted dehydrogenase